MKSDLSTSSRGSALLICLAIIALMLAVVTALFSKAQNAYTIESSGAARVRSEIFAQSALEYTVGLLTREVTDPNYSEVIQTGGTKVFRPKTPGNMSPRSQFKPVLNQAQSTHMPSILKQSIPAMDPKASNILTRDPNKQGRFVHGMRWNDPWLYFAVNPFGTGTECPNWIYFDDQGPTNNATPSIQGRAAFNIYHINNLIDFSVGGYPANLANDVSAQNSLKGSLAGADITQLGWVYSDPENKYVDVRSRRSTRDGSYVQHVLSNTNGFLEPPAGDTQFVSRLDLLRFSKSNGLNFNPLAYMTAWSRALEAPSWYPAVITSANVFAPGVLRQSRAKIKYRHLDGTQIERIAEPDEPVVSRRFPLSRLGWFESTSIYRDEAILQYFGLVPASNGRWKYQGTHIKTISELAVESRDPNFFEMLKAAIVSGSLGASYTTTPEAALAQSRDSDKDLQILRIGACIIDAAGSNNEPTVIALRSAAGTGDQVTGVKDLPYIHSVRLRQIIKTDASGAIDRIDQFAVPILVNPHATSTVSTPRPQIRLRLIGFIEDPEVTLGATTVALTSRFSTENELESSRIIPIDSNTFGTLHPPTEVATSSAPEPGPETAEMPNYFTDTVRAFWLATGSSTGSSSHGTIPGTARLRRFNIVLEYLASNSSWVVYDSLLADDIGMPAVGLGENVTTSFAGTGGINISPSNGNFTGPSTPYLLKPDPRTTRWGIAKGRTSAPLTQPPTEVSDSYALPSQTLTPSGQFPAVADPDSVVRMNDLRVGSLYTTNGTKSMQLVLGNMYSSANLTTASEERNMILHRPFHTVAELGTVFRDQPWKTLNFATSDSADAALLDYFTINEVGEKSIVAGRFNLNVQSPIDAIVAQLRGSSYLVGQTNSVMLKAHAEALSTQIKLITQKTPFSSPANLVGAVEFNRLPTNMKASKQRQETMARALGTSGQTRTWNFFIDLIAQAGPLAPVGSTNLEKDFMARGETRLWMHVAIDRFTGKVVASHIEAYQE